MKERVRLKEVYTVYRWYGFKNERNNKGIDDVLMPYLLDEGDCEICGKPYSEHGEIPFSKRYNFYQHLPVCPGNILLKTEGGQYMAMGDYVFNEYYEKV